MACGIVAGGQPVRGMVYTRRLSRGFFLSACYPQPPGPPVKTAKLRYTAYGVIGTARLTSSPKLCKRARRIQMDPWATASDVRTERVSGRFVG